MSWTTQATATTAAHAIDHAASLFSSHHQRQLISTRLRSHQHRLQLANATAIAAVDSAAAAKANEQGRGRGGDKRIKRHDYVSRAAPVMPIPSRHLRPAVAPTQQPTEHTASHYKTLQVVTLVAVLQQDSRKQGAEVQAAE